MRRARLLLLAVPLLLAPAPARAADPTVLVAARGDGALVKVTLTGRVAQSTVLVPAAGRSWHVPTQANGASVAFVTSTENGASDVGVVDAGSGTQRRLSRDGRSGFLLVSRDGRFRYVLRTNPENGNYVQLVRIDARNAVKPLLTIPAASVKKGDVVLSSASLSADGRTLYVARTFPAQPSQVVAIDTTTGKQRAVDAGGLKWVHHVVVSPDGKWLAVSYFDGQFVSRARLVPLAGGAARDLPVPYGDAMATAFSADSGTVVLGSRALLLPGPALHLADVATGVVLPVAGSEDLYQAVAVA